MDEELLMSQDTRGGHAPDSQHVTPTVGYYLPEHAQYELARLQEFLEFLSRITAPRTRQDESSGFFRITPAELSHCFHVLATQITPVLADMEGPAHVALTFDEPFH